MMQSYSNLNLLMESLLSKSIILKTAMEQNKRMIKNFTKSTKSILPLLQKFCRSNRLMTQWLDFKLVRIFIVTQRTKSMIQLIGNKILANLLSQMSTLTYRKTKTASVNALPSAVPFSKVSKKKLAVAKLEKRR